VSNTEIVKADPRDIQLGTFSRIGLTLPEDISFDEWKTVGASLADQGAGLPWAVGDWLRLGERKWGDKYTEAVELTGMSSGVLRDAVWVANQFDHLSRRRDKLSWSHHREVAGLATPEEQDEWLDRAEAEEWTRADLRKALRVRRLKAEREANPLPAGKYDLIYADPPWQYDFSETDCRKIENQYPTMTVDEIAALEPPAADDCVLYLWGTAPKLREALIVLGAWGFEYKTHAVWDKQKIGMGYWFRGQHELLLVGTRGRFSPPPEDKRTPSVFSFPRGRHSEKPDSVYELIEGLFPDATKCELFARSQREGWTAWGNEAGATQ